MYTAQLGGRLTCIQLSDSAKNNGDIKKKKGEKRRELNKIKCSCWINNSRKSTHLFLVCLFVCLFLWQLV